MCLLIFTFVSFPFFFDYYFVCLFVLGATLSKGMNRGLGTLSAGFLAVFSEYLGDCFGSRVLRAIFIAFGVFVVGEHR